MAVKQYRAWNPNTKEYVYWYAGKDIPEGIQGDTIVIVVDGSSPSGEIPNEIEKIIYLPDDESSALESYTSIVTAVNEGKLPLLIIGNENDGNYLPMNKVSEEGYEFSVVLEDGLHKYIANNNTITYSFTQIDGGQELSAESPVKIEGDVIKVATAELKVKAPLTFNADTMEIALDPALCTINIDAITDWIDITNEWEFINDFRLSYLGESPGDANAMTILYSPKFNFVKFTGTLRINRNTSTIGQDWAVFLHYNGNRFYTTKDTTENNLVPKIGVQPPIGNMMFVPGTGSDGTTMRSLLKLGYIGDPSQPKRYQGLAFQLLYNYSGSVYGGIASNLVLKVFPKE